MTGYFILCNDDKIKTDEKSISYLYKDIEILKNDELTEILMNNHNQIIPNWIIQGSKTIKREFLSGFISARGITIISLQGITTITSYFIISNIFNQIQHMFEEIGILCKSGLQQDFIGCFHYIQFNDNIENVLLFADTICFPYNEEERKQSAFSIEYFKYKLNCNNIEDTYKLSIERADNDCVCVPIENIIEIEPEPVYDFTTISENHSFVASSFVVSNCPAEKLQRASQ